MNSNLPAATDVSIVQAEARYDDSAAVTRWVAKAFDSLPGVAATIRPGDRVVLKPNWVKEEDTRRPGSDSWIAVITHPEVILGVVRWIGPKLAGRGSIAICDAPQGDSSFDKIRQYCHLDELLARCRAEFPGIEFSMFDMRLQELSAVDGVSIARRELPGDPAGDVDIHLDEKSEFFGYRGLGKLYGAAYDFAETNRQHTDPHHEYKLSKTPMNADVLVNIPKLKTHKKVGVTVALKNMVGITARTNWLPRHTEGTPDQGGDEFSESTFKRKLEMKLMRGAKRILKGRYFLSRFFVPIKKLGKKILGSSSKVTRNGNWPGNDTAWRMILDLHKCIFHFDGQGQPRKAPLRQLILVDGLVAGEGDGPMNPDSKPCGVILAGVNPVAVDCVSAALMGFDWKKLKLLTHCFSIQHLPLANFRPEEIRAISDNAAWQGSLDELRDCFEFRPHFAWVGSVEKYEVNPEDIRRAQSAKDSPKDADG